jgi:hypothetical protein
VGGEGALLEREESIGGMLKCLTSLKKEDTAKFFGYDELEKPW